MAIEFKIVQPTDVVEASFTDDPFDASKASVQFEVTFGAGDQADFLLFQLVDPAKREFTLDTTPGPLFSNLSDPVRQSDGTPGDPNTTIRTLQALTVKPELISPVATDGFGKWTFVRISDGVFKATPKGFTPTAPGSTQKALFTLYNVNVTTDEGKCGIAVSSVTNGVRSGRKVLLVRKVNPALRIDEFKVNPAFVVAGAAVTLSWATTGATTVKVTTPDHQSGVTETKDGSRTEHPATTSTYTLTASGGSGTVVAQVTVSVTDQVNTPKVITDQVVIGGLTVNARTGSTVGFASAVQVDQKLTAGGTARAGGLIQGDLEVQGSLTATGLKGGAAIPPGIIVMWSGKAIAGRPDIPGGWALCNGQEVARSDGTGRIKTPNLSERFIMASATAADADKGLDSTGQMTLDIKHIPPHKHTVKSAAHSHTVSGGTSSGSGNTAGPFAMVIFDDFLIGGDLRQHKFDQAKISGGDHGHDMEDAGGIPVNGTLVVQPFDVVPKFYSLAYIMKT